MTHESENEQDPVSEEMTTENGENLESKQQAESEQSDNVVEAADQDSIDGESNESPEETIERLTQALNEAELKVKDESLRAQAEMQNVRKRSERDVANAHKFGQEKLIKELFAVVDSLERGIQTVDEQEGELEPAVKTIRDGSDLTLKMLVGVFDKFQVKQLDPAGEPFDPQFHEAISMIDSPDSEPNSVITVVQKGYTLNDRLVRPAMVVVAKA